MFEYLMINHCAPTLAGIKVANMFMCDCNVADENVAYWNDILHKYNIQIAILRRSKDKALVYVYRLHMLNDLLKDEKVHSFLRLYSCRYKKDIKDSIKVLKDRCKNSAFPHEIGIFLGYPLEDVKLFIENKGKNYKYCGFWKVYTDEKKSMELFEKYKTCTCFFSSSFLNGRDVTSLCVA